MARRSYEKKPLYRRVNRTTLRAPCGHGGEYRWQRNTKTENASEKSHQGMGPKHQHGLDYTPLFKFLLKKVGQDWDTVHSEAVGRLDRQAPLHWLVADNDKDTRPIVRIGESSYYSGMFVGPDNRLTLVAPEIRVEDIYPACPCCTHTFNGVTVPNAFDPDRADQIFKLIVSYR